MPIRRGRPHTIDVAHVTLLRGEPVDLNDYVLLPWPSHAEATYCEWPRAKADPIEDNRHLNRFISKPEPDHYTGQCGHTLEGRAVWERSLWTDEQWSAFNRYLTRNHWAQKREQKRIQHWLDQEARYKADAKVGELERRLAQLERTDKARDLLIHSLEDQLKDER